MAMAKGITITQNRITTSSQLNPTQQIYDFKLIDIDTPSTVSTYTLYTLQNQDTHTHTSANYDTNTNTKTEKNLCLLENTHTLTSLLQRDFLANNVL